VIGGRLLLLLLLLFLLSPVLNDRERFIQTRLETRYVDSSDAADVFESK
jgi:hypothetical protein